MTPEEMQKDCELVAFLARQVNEPPRGASLLYISKRRDYMRRLVLDIAHGLGGKKSVFEEITQERHPLHDLVSQAADSASKPE